MLKTIYMVVTADDFELPMEVSDKAQDIADFCGIARETVFRYASEKRKCPRLKYRIVRTKIDEDGGYKIKCALCGNEFEVSRFRGQKYCSDLCKRKAQEIIVRDFKREKRKELVGLKNGEQ